MAAGRRRAAALAVLGTIAHSDGRTAADEASTDFVSLFQRLADASSTTTQLDVAPFNLTSVPNEVQTRLQQFSLEFSDMPPLMQRALLWDSGYAVASDDGSSLAQIFTKCGASMADLALDKEEFQRTKCAIKRCGATAKDTVYFTRECRADRLVAAAKCSTTAVDSESTSPLWTHAPSTVSADSVPEISVRRHRWSDPEFNQQVHVFAIHTARDGGATARADVCSASALPLVIPCVPFQSTDARWCRPTRSKRMDSWLDEFATAFHTQRKQQIDTANAAELAARKAATRLVKDLHGVTVDSEFKFDGTSSDLAQQFYRRHRAGDVVPSVPIEGSLPSDIRHRLSEVSLDFDELPPLLQRALIWDSGYAFGDASALASIYVPCGSTMADIALARRVFELAGCEAHNCTDSQSGGRFSRTKSCTGDQIAAASLCASTNVNSPVHVSIWADGGGEDLLPDVNIQRHSWEDRNRSYLIYGIHVVRNEVAQLNCPSRAAMIIPCLPYEAISSPNQWCRPKPGALVTSWLRVAAKNNQLNLLLLLPILFSVAIVVTGLAFCIRRRSWWNRIDAKLAQSPNGFDNELSHTTLSSTSNQNEDICDGFKLVHSMSPYRAGPSVDSDVTLDSSFASRSSMESFAALSSNPVLNTLVNNPALSARRLEFTDLRFQRIVAKGGHGEVWLCELHDELVAVKQLLRTRKNRYEDLEAFSNEIALTASMDHPNIVRFIGVAWTTLPNLCMVTEYMVNGDLQQYLRRPDASVYWNGDKLRIATGIARALKYLHQRSPVTIHRDLKSKNVLLSAGCDAKLIDFGVSRSKLGDMMTNGVGTPYWTAPEILQGQPYTEKADMYSFGIVLCELDTCVSPYQDMKSFDGTPEFTPLQILQHVVAGDLRPTISSSCPSPVAALVHSCLDPEAHARPSAAQALTVLEELSAGETISVSPVLVDVVDQGQRHSIAFSL